MLIVLCKTGLTVFFPPKKPVSLPETYATYVSFDAQPNYCPSNMKMRIALLSNAALLAMGIFDLTLSEIALKTSDNKRRLF